MKGIDISNLNGNVNITSVKNAGYDFVVSKITEGETFVDSYGSSNVQNTKNNGLIAGAYHFGRFANMSKAVREANFFKSHCPSNVDFVVLDFEQSEASGDMTSACVAFLDLISSIAPALIYCNPNYIKLHLNSAITRYPLWIAHYGVSSPSTPLWGTYAIWQYSETGRASGVSGRVDLNITGPAFNIISHRGGNTNIGDLSVTRLQQELNSMINANLAVDGILGTVTIRAVRKFQSLMGLRVDGIAGANTWKAINQIRAYPTIGINYPRYEYPTRWVQMRVGARIDGIFGNETADKVKGFQKNINSAHGENLVVDGIVGKETWRCMFKY